MKTIIRLLAVLLLTLSATCLVNAQATIKVTWQDGQNCDCPLPGQSYYSVYDAVFDQCTYPYTTVFEHTNIESSSATESFIDLDEFCDEETGDCYLVIAEVKKWCPDGQGGYEDECHGKENGEPYSCQELMDDTKTWELPQIPLNY